MIEQEAIEYFENQKKNPFINHLKFDKYADVAIEALQKQIPQAVYLTGDGEWNGHIVIDTARCQSCGFEVEECDDNWERDYCPNCGQMWRWELEELEEFE